MLIIRTATLYTMLPFRLWPILKIVMWVGSATTTLAQSVLPTQSPSAAPTLTPTSTDSRIPTSLPTSTGPPSTGGLSTSSVPVPLPTMMGNVPTYPQTAQPTFIARPSAVPTGTPTSVPTAVPSQPPTVYNPNMTIFPTDTPSSAPTSLPSPTPTRLPTLSVEPTRRPTDSKEPSFVPTSLPSSVPTFTFFPTKVPVETESPTEYSSLPPTTSVPSSSPTNASFLCRGFSCNGPNGALGCPDYTVQSRQHSGSAGGNVFVTVIAAQNLEDRDGTTVPDGGVARSSDPYVRVRVGTEGHWSTKETQRVGNDENPRWSETLSMGWHRAGEARMRFEVLDYDTGLEVIDGDDSLGTASLWLPFCSTLTAGFDELDCDKEVCAAHDSSWAMSHRQLCREEGWLLLNDGYYTTVGTQACCETNAACLRIVVEIVPFQLYVDDIHTSNSNPDESFATSLFVDPAIESAGELPTAGFGQPYVDKSIYTVNGESSQIDAAGALLLQTTAEDGRFNQLLSDDDATDSSFRHARLSVNARTTLTICRLASCYPVPSWLHEWDYYVSIPVLKEARYQGFACYQRIAGPTKRNKYGTVEENSVDLGWAQCEKNYFVVAEPHFGAPSRAHIWQLHFERIKFAVKVVQLGIPLLIVLPGTVTLLRLCEFRLDRLDGYLFSLGRDVAAEGWRAASKLPATLFLGDGASTNNRELRHNHYWATRCVLFLLTIPCAVFWTAGVIIASTVQPVNAGLGILLVGTAILGILGALSRWRLDGWRLTSVSCSALIASVGCILIFSIAAVLLDPKLTGNEKSPPVDFIALTVALLTAGLVPLAVEATEFNALVHAAKGALATALAGAAADIQKEFPDDEDGDYWLMKECYSACSDSPHFDFVSDIAGDLCGLSNRINSAQVAAARRALLLAGSRSVLVVYIMSAFLLTSKGPLALAIAIFLSITDVIHTCLGRGSVFWSPTKTVLLMAAARALIVFGGATFWVVGLSAAHSIYGYVLTLEIVNKYLPYLEQLEACGIVFLARGGTTRRTLISSHFDVAGTPEFVLMVLTTTLFSIVLFASYATPTGLPLPHIMLSSRVQIPTYTFAVMSLLFVAFCGTARGFVRASHLGSQNLLGGADTAYLFFPWLTLPKMLAGLAYICLVTAGLLLWGASDTPSALAACALGPISVLCLLRAGSAWLANDCRLVVWPPHIIHAIEGDNVSESELAFGMLQAMMGSGSSQRPDAKTLGSLDLPQLLRTREDDTEAIAAINMPMLPPKSTMKKRAEATIVSSISQATAQHAAPVVPGETTARPHVLRRQVINLGLHNVRINKLKRILASPPKEGDDERARKRKRRGLLPSLTLKEVFVHLNGLVWQHICSQFASAKAKVADEVSSEQPHTEAIAPVALDSSVDPAWLHVPMWEAVVTGCLLPEEYTTLLCACSSPILYVLLGWFLAMFSHPHFAGHLLWAVGTAVFCTIYPIVKWFKVYKVTNDMTYTGVFGWVVYVGILAWAFYSWLDARYDIVETLLIVDALILYPVCLNELYRLLVWIDDGCQDQNPSVRATAGFTREAGEANVELDASDAGHGRVDKPKIQIRRLFINMVDLEGNIVYDSAVGAFGLQFYVNGQWEATVVDDSLPMLGDGTLKGGIEALAALDAYKHDERPPVTGPEQDGDERPKVDITTVLDASTIEAYQQRHKDCAGFAVSHATEMGELWVSLLEKGVAKYYGSYANIEVGFVHHGLELLTGNRSECFHIAEAARGVGKRALWGSLLRYYENEYILGAGAVTAEHASPSLKDLGLLFGATYTIYEVIDVMPEGLKLIKLRNPPGHAQSFKGSWSQKSHRWTERLRHKFIHNLDPQTFWMSFDEFCCAFRCLFICHYYTDESARWRRLAVSGEWTCGQSHVQDDVVEPPANERENTAAGLPSSHNPGCEVERNPQYAIVVHRPITLRMSISQTDAKGRANATVLPIAAYLCRADNRSSIDIDRVTKLGNHNIVTTTGPVRRTRSVDAYVDNLDPGIYILLIGAFQAEMEGHFTATIISNYAVDVTQIWPPTWREAPSEPPPKITGKA